MKVFVVGNMHIREKDRLYLKKLGYDEFIEETKSVPIKQRLVDLISCDATFTYSLTSAAIRNTELAVAKMCNMPELYQGSCSEPVVVLDILSKFMNITTDEIISHKRKRNLVYARIIYANICKKLSIREVVSRELIHRDHQTMFYYTHKLDDFLKYDQQFNELYYDFLKYFESYVLTNNND